jgi:uncharacterized protein YbjQ (UPF0145 family)
MGGAEPQETPEQEREEALSREQVERGGITVAAERRLRELRTSDGGGSFTSDLSVSGFALCHQLGLRPVSQVMGSSVFQVGYLATEAWMPYGVGAIVELEVLSQAWNGVRERALARLELEARHAGADAVVGVQINSGAREWAEGGLEYQIVGTAVRREGAPANEHPVVTELSVSDYAKLVSAGIEPLGIVAWTSVFFVADNYETQAMSGGLGGRMMFPENEEIASYTQGVYSAREHNMERLGAQARELGASGIVGVRISHHAQRHDVGGVNRSRSGLMVTFNAIGTAVRERGATQPQSPKTVIDLFS